MQRAVGESIKELAEEAQRVLIDVWSQGPAAGSKAATWREGEVEFAGELTSAAPVYGAQEAVFLGFLAGVDHARTAALALATGTSFFSIATLARGCLEASARSWWILTSETPREQVARFIAANIQELQQEQKRSPAAQMVARDRDPISISQLLASHRRDLANVWDGPLIRPSFTALAGELANQYTPSRGRETYSELSSIAHGEAVGVNEFLRRGEGRNGFEMPARFLSARHFDFYGTLGVTTTRFFQDWDRSPGDSWLRAVRRASIF